MLAMLERPVTKAHVICGQEVKLAGEQLEAARKAADRNGWKLSLAPAVITKADGDGRHRSAGLVVVAPHHVGSELAWPFGREDLSPAEAPGRLTGRWISMLGGLVVMSMYMENAVGWNE